MLNNEKLQDWDFCLTSKPTRTKIQPLPDMQLHSLPITTCTTSALKPTPKRNILKKNGLYITENPYTLINLYKKTAPHMTHETSVLKPETEKAHMLINASMKNLAKTDATAQMLITQQLIDKCVPLFNTSEFLLKTEKQESHYALELFGFLHTLAEEKKLITSEDIKKQTVNAKIGVCSSVSYILHACRYLQEMNDTTLSLLNQQKYSVPTEIEATCQFLINYGDTRLSTTQATKTFIEAIMSDDKTNPVLTTIYGDTTLSTTQATKTFETIISDDKTTPVLTAIAQSPIYVNVINKLHSAQFKKNDPLLKDLYYILAELYYHHKDYHNAHVYYAKNTFDYLESKKVSKHAFHACLINTNNFHSQEIESICQFLNTTILSPEETAKSFLQFISHNNNIHQLLYKISQTSLNSLIITTLQNAQLGTTHQQFAILNHVVAELYFNNQDYHNAHTYYSKNSAGYLGRKRLSMNAFIACIASAQDFSAETINYLLSLREAGHKLAKIQQTNPQLSYNIGLFAHALCNNKTFTFETHTQTSLLLNALSHLTYAQKNGTWNTQELNLLATMRVEFHTLLSTIYMSEKQPGISLKHIQHAIEYHAGHSNNTQDCAILTLLEQAEKNNLDMYQKHIEIITALLHLIYNQAQQNDYDLQKKYDVLMEFAASDLCAQLLPYLEHAYTTNKKNKNQIAYLLATLYQCTNNYLKAYNYKRILTQDSPYLTQLNTGMFALNNKNDAQIIIDALKLLEQNKNSDNPIIKPMCQFVINELSVENFIKTITSQKDISNTIGEIAKSPFCSKIITQLHDVALEKNNPLLSQINCVLAELYYHSNNTSKAHELYISLPENSLLGAAYKKVKSNAFNACIENTIKFDEKTINYLSCLSGNIGNKLKTINLIDPKKSYHIVFLIDALLQTNPKMNNLEKIDFIINGLNHLAYTQNSDIWNDKIKSIMAHINADFNLLLSNLYLAQKNYTAALKHYRNALEYRASRTNCVQYSQIVSILMQAEQNNPELYAQCALLIQNLLYFMDNEVEKIEPQKNHSLLSQFASYDLCQQLMPYCEESYATNKQSCNDVFYLMALCCKNNNDYDNAHNYINKLENPTNGVLSLKSEIYALTQNILPHEELATVLKLFIYNKKQSSEEEKRTILSLISTSTKFFIETQNYTLALKLITKLIDNNDIHPVIISLAYHIEEDLITNKNPYFKNWLKELINNNFYAKIKNASCYKGKTNYAISFLLTQQEPVASYEKIIEHAKSALNSNDLPEQIIDLTQKICAKAYYDWATTVEHDTDMHLCLLNKSLEYNDVDAIRYEKAIFIIDNSNDPNLMNEALNILGDNINKNNDAKTLSLIALGKVLCNYHDNPARIPLLQQLVSLDINAGLAFLEGQTVSKELIIYLMDIFAGRSQFINAELKDTYINHTKELEYINVLINSDDKDIDKESLLKRKVILLLDGTDTPDDNAYDQALECFEQLRLENNIVVFDAPIFQKRTEHLITTNNTTESAIEWCCFAADSIIRENTPLFSVPPATKEQKKLADYLQTAAKNGNINAQLTILPYYDAIQYHTSGMPYYQALGYTHAALMNPGSTKKELKLYLLIGLLQQLTERGVALPYYILCDYFKNNKDELEKTMLLFSKSKTQLHLLDDTTDTAQKIAFSCKPIFMPYINRCMKNVKSPSLIDALATFTFAAMCAYADDADILKASVGWMMAAYPLCNGKLNLPHYKIPIQTLLASIYYKRALIAHKSTKKIDLDLLYESTKLEYLPAIHKLAEIAIQQYETGKFDVVIPEKDFLPQLQKDVQFNTSSNSRSLELFEKYIVVKDKFTKEKPINNTINSTVQVKAVPQEKRMAELSKIANQKKMIKNINYKENSIHYVKAMEFCDQGNIKFAAELLQKAVNQNKDHTCSLMMLALSCLTGELTPQDYIKSGKLLGDALYYGLVIKTRKDTTKQFHNIYFLDILFLFMESLATKKHPVENTFDLFTIIKTMLENNGINMTDFCEMFYKITAIDLSTIPQWSGEENKTNQLIIRQEPQSTVTVTEDVLAEQLNDLFKIADGDIWIDTDPNLKLSQTSFKIMDDTLTKKLDSLYKKTDTPTKVSQNYLDALDAFEQGNTTKGLALMEHEATKEKNPLACIVLASKYFTGCGVPQRSYLLSKKYLCRALSYGIIEKKIDNKSFLDFQNDDFLKILCKLIETIITLKCEPSSAFVITSQKESFLSVIKRKLIAQNFDLTMFCDIVRKKTNIDLPVHPGWRETEEKSTIKSSTTNPAVQSKPVARDKRVSELAKIANQKKMVKHTNYAEASHQYITAVSLYQQGIPKEADTHLQQVIKKQKNHPCAFMKLALRQLHESLTTKKYALTTKSLTQALSNGLTIKAARDKTKQFHNIHFLDTLFWYLESLLMENHPLENAHDLVSMIRKTLQKDGINLTDFCELFQTITGIKLSMSPSWSMEMAVLDLTEGNVEEQALDIYNRIKSAPELTSTKKQKTDNPDNADLKKSIIKYPDYKETSTDFLLALQAYQQRDMQRALALMHFAATQKHHPCACIILATNYFRGDGIEKNISLSEKFLGDALSYGLIEKQICTNDFLSTLCNYIEVIISTPDEPSVKERLLSVIKKILISHDIDLTQFCGIVHEEKKINLLLFFPEWIDTRPSITPKQIQVNNLTDCFKVIEEKNNKVDIQKTNIADLKTKLVKDLNNKTVSRDFISALLISNKDAKKSADMMETLAIDKDDPCACIITASHYHVGDIRPQNILFSEQSLKNAFIHGLQDSQFCNSLFLDNLCKYIKTIITVPSDSTIKESLFSIIQNNLIAHKITCSDFCELVNNNIEIQLSSIPEWAGTNQNSTQDEQKKLSIKMDKFFQNMNNTAMTYLHNTEQNSTILDQPLSISELKHSMVSKDPYPLSFLYEQGLRHYNQGKIQEGLEQMELSISTENNNPNSNLFVSSVYLMGQKVEKNIQRAQNLLCNSLSRGFIENNFCNKVFLDLLVGYIAMIIKGPHSTEEKQRLCSIIRETLTTNEINLSKFYEIVHEDTNIILSLEPEWLARQKPQGNAQQISSKIDKIIEGKNLPELVSTLGKLLSTDNESAVIEMIDDLAQVNADFEKSIIKDPADIPSANYLAAGEAFKEGNVQKFFEFNNKAIKEEKNPSSFICLASQHLIGKAIQKNYNLSEQYLCNGLAYGLVKQKFCNSSFLYTLFGYLKDITTFVPAKQKQHHLLTIVRKALEQNKIDLTLFCALCQKNNNTKISFGVEQSQSKSCQLPSKNNQLVEMEKKQVEPVINELPKTTTNNNALFILNNQIVNTDIANLAKSLIKEPEDPIAQILFDIHKALENADAKNVITLCQKSIKEEQNPTAFLYMSAQCLLGGQFIQKNYASAEEYLRKSLEYGLTKQKFCNLTFLSALFGYMDDMFKSVPGKQKQNKFLSIIKKALEQNKIDLVTFHKIHESNSKNKLPF